MPFKIVWSLADSKLLILSWSQINPPLLKKIIVWISYVFHSVQLSHSVVSDSAAPWTAVPQASLSIISFWSLLKLISLSQWCHPTISSSVIPFSSHLQSFPASGSFQMSHLFTSSGQSIGVSASKSLLPMNIQDWFPLRWTGWISLQSKGLSRAFSNATVQKNKPERKTPI